MTTTEHTELLRILAEQRHTLLITVRDISDDDVAKRTTNSEFTLGALLKHVTQVERHWTAILAQAEGEQSGSATLPQERPAWDPGRESLADLIEDYQAAARELEAVVATIPDLDRPCPMPEGSLLGAGVVWSARRILLHLLRETSQHCGHADIIREQLDGANTTTQLLADLRAGKF